MGTRQSHLQTPLPILALLGFVMPARALSRSRLDHGPYVDVGYLSGAWQAEGIQDHRCDVLRLQQEFRLIRRVLHPMDLRLHLGRRSSQINTQYPNAMWVDLTTQRIGNGFEGVLRCVVL